MIDLKSFLTKDSFSQIIEDMIKQDSDLNYFTAVLEFAADNDKDPEELLPFMLPVLLDKVKKSATDSGLIITDSATLDSYMD